MLTNISPLASSGIISVLLLWLIMLIIGQMVKIILLKSVDSNSAETKGEDDFRTGKIDEKKGLIRKWSRIFSLALTLAAFASIVVFLFFMNNPDVKQADKKGDTIKTAPLPENFRAPSDKEIAESNNQAVSADVEKMKEEAVKANNQAINEAKKIFK